MIPGCITFTFCLRHLPGGGGVLNPNFLARVFSTFPGAMSLTGDPHGPKVPWQRVGAELPEGSNGWQHLDGTCALAGFSATPRVLFTLLLTRFQYAPHHDCDCRSWVRGQLRVPLPRLEMRLCEPNDAPSLSALQRLYLGNADSEQPALSMRSS